MLERTYAENFDALPRKTGADGRNYYDPVNYTDLGSDAAGHLGAGLAVVGSGAAIVGCLSNPIGWGMCGGTLALAGASASVGGMVLTAFNPPDPVQYPLLRIPVLYGNAPYKWGFGIPRGYY